MGGGRSGACLSGTSLFLTGPVRAGVCADLFLIKKLIIFRDGEYLLKAEAGKSDLAAKFKPVSVVAQYTEWTFAHVW